jgi:PAS domain S-box-containing protein
VAATAKKTVKKPNENMSGISLHSLENTEFYRLLVNSIQDYAIFLLDGNGCIASWNLGAQKLKGYKPEEIIGKHFSIFYTEEDLASKKPTRELEIARNTGHAEDEYWRVRKDGTKFWANVVITALYDESDELIGYAKVTRDLTERKSNEDMLLLANKELIRQREELEVLSNAKDEFISLASHQLRTPATGVKQYMGLILEGYAGELSEQQRDYLLKANESNDRQIELVNNLLQVAQMDAGKIVLSKSLTDIGAMAQDVVDEQVDSFKNRHQQLKLDIPDGRVLVGLDGKRFRMVLENLIDNASKYTPDGGKITVEVKESDGWLRVMITDNGVGIPAESLPQLFNKFSRIQNELSDSVGGSGLGLYWAQRVVELHGGWIEVSSRPGKGSEFIIRIPIGETA